MLGGAVHRRPLGTMLQQYRSSSPVPAASFLAVAAGALPGDKRRGMHVGGGGSAWRKPEAGRLKLNFDGSSRQQRAASGRSASIGGVVRDHEGRFVLGYAERIGKGATSSVAELAALRRGLELALEHGWRGRALWVEGDAMAAVDAARGKGRRPRVCRGRAEEDRRLCVEIAEMLPLLEMDEEDEDGGSGIMVVSHVGRGGNRVAHGFARLGHGAARPRVWRGVPPAEVMKYLHRDAQGE